MQKDKYHVPLIFVIKNSDAHELIYKTEIDSQTWKPNYGTKGDSGYGKRH